MTITAALWSYASGLLNEPTSPDAFENKLYFIERIDVTRTVTFGSQLSGGFGQCSFSVPGTWQRSAQRIHQYQNAHVVLFNEYGKRLYEGYVYEASPNGLGLQVSASGYYAKAGDRNWEEEAFIGHATMTVTEMLSMCSDYIRDWSYVRSFLMGGDYVVTTDEIQIERKKVRDILERVLGYGYRASDPRQIFFAIWDRRTPHLVVEPSLDATPNPRWVVNANTLRVTNAGEIVASLNSGGVYNRIYAVYDDQKMGTSLTTYAEDLLSIQRYGLREGYVQNGGSAEGLALAEDLRDAALERFRYPRQVAQITIRGIMPRFAGGWEPLSHVRAGQEIMVRDLASAPIYAAAYRGMSTRGLSGFILRAEYDAASNSLRVDLGMNDVAFDVLMSRLGLSGGLG